jgi:hypothetical protein
LGSLSSGKLGLRREQFGVDIRQNASLGDDYTAEETVKFFIVTDGELQMTGDDTRLLVVTSGVTGEFENFGTQAV